jgi:hypothetical protein
MLSDITSIYIALEDNESKIKIKEAVQAIHRAASLIFDASREDVR